MKHLFLLLLAINLGVFIWGYQREQTLASNKPVVRPDVGNLLLLSEREPPPPDEPKLAAIPIPMPVTELEAEPVERRAQVQVVAPLPQLVEEAFLSEASSIPEEPDTEPEPEIVQTFESEPVPEPESESEQKIAMVAENREPVIEKACYRLGPVEARPSAKELTDQLALLGVAATRYEEVVEKPAGYWVVIPPHETVSGAAKKVRELQAAGVKDVWRFTRGSLKNAVSLGLFSQLKNAKRVERQIAAKGFTPEIRLRNAQVTQYWLGFESVDKPPIPEETQQEFKREYANLELVSSTCLDIATP